MTDGHRHLQRDPVLAKVLKKYDPPIWQRPADLFAAIIRNIIGQQLSGGPARIILARFVALFPKGKFPTPKQILAKPDQKLRDVGMSWAKVKYVKALASAVASRELDLNEVKELSDEEVIIELTKIKGIGRWTAEMILIFHLRRPDVFSLGDLGLRTAIAKLYKVKRDDLKKIAKISATWSPHRSLACRYLWMSLDNQ